MAVVKVGQIKTTLEKSIAYILQDNKTDNGRLISASFTTRYIHDPQYLSDRMMNDNKASRNGLRPGTVLARHVIQSFNPRDTITPEEAHRIGEQFAQSITANGDYKYVIATHIDRHHIHNHIIICNTNSHTYHKMRMHKNTLAAWRAISDTLCKKENLTIITPTYAGKSFSEIYPTLRGEGHKNRLTTLIDRACMNARTFSEFQTQLSGYGITVKPRGKHLTYTDQATQRSFRDTRLGIMYTENSIMSKLNHHTVKYISVNDKLIRTSTPDTITIWIPGTHRQKTITIPLSMVVRDNHTLRIYMAEDTPILLADKRGRYDTQVSITELYQYFSQPIETYEDLTRLAASHPLLVQGTSEKHTRYLRYQAHILHTIQQQADTLAALYHYDNKNGHVQQALTAATTELSTVYNTFSSLMVARQDILTQLTNPHLENKDKHQLQKTLTADTAELNRLERKLTHTAHAITLLKKLRNQAYEKANRQSPSRN